MATNPVASLPDADAVRAALKACELSIVSEAMRASDTVDACRIRLPALAWAEKDGTVTNSERGISRQRPFLPAPGEARQDWWILSEVARRLGYGEAFAWTGVADIFREHAALSAFENDGTPRLRHRRPCRHRRCGLRQARAVRLARPARPCRVAQAGASSPTAASSTAIAARASSRRRRARPCMRRDAERPLRLNTGRVRDQWHTMTRTGKSARLAGHRPEPTDRAAPRRCARARPGQWRHRRGDQRLGPRRAARPSYGLVTRGRRLCAHALDGAGLARRRASTPPSIPRSIRSPASPSSSTRPSKFAVWICAGMARFSLAGR